MVGEQKERKQTSLTPAYRIFPSVAVVVERRVRRGVRIMVEDVSTELQAKSLSSYI